ncbi:MAG TPA: hypothetical protein VF486_21445 [Actinomycetes bacterium]
MTLPSALGRSEERQPASGRADRQGAQRFDGMHAYGNSKLVGVLFTYELARQRLNPSRNDVSAVAMLAIPTGTHPRSLSSR